MHLLGIVSWVYAGVLVIALAASLTAIWINLLSIAKVLRETYRALAVVADETAPLEKYLKQIETNVTTAARAIGAGREDRDSEERVEAHGH